jgi:hypothetical protein
MILPPAAGGARGAAVADQTFFNRNSHGPAGRRSLRQVAG